MIYKQFFIASPRIAQNVRRVKCTRSSTQMRGFIDIAGNYDRNYDRNGHRKSYDVSSWWRHNSSIYTLQAQYLYRVLKYVTTAHYKYHSVRNDLAVCVRLFSFGFRTFLSVKLRYAIFPDTMCSISYHNHWKIEQNPQVNVFQTTHSS